jgi:glutamate-1-semialdehyde 2,1-aminomutase
MILGHAHPQVINAVQEVAADGLSFGAPTELETRLARRVIELMPSIELVRFVSSGTEATMSALRLARGFTGRDTIVKFEGCYHGHSDSLLIKAGSGALTLGVPTSPGVPKALANHTVTLNFNDAGQVAEVFRQIGAQIACVIVEPVAGNMNCVPPAPGFLDALRRECDRAGALLIFDEVITGFRFARGGAQEYFGVTPDLTTMAKGLGGGFPVAAIGGSRDAMSMIAEGRYSHSGTYNANTIACAAVSATMDVLAEPGLYERQRELGETLMNGLRKLAAEADLPVIVEGLGTVFQIWFSEQPIRNWRDAQRYANEELFTRWWQEMLLRGVLFHPSQYENLFLSLVHTADDVSDMLGAAQEAFAVVARMVSGSGRLG